MQQSVSELKYHGSCCRVFHPLRTANIGFLRNFEAKEGGGRDKRPEIFFRFYDNSSAVIKRAGMKLPGGETSLSS